MVGLTSAGERHDLATRKSQNLSSKILKINLYVSVSAPQLLSFLPPDTLTIFCLFVLFVRQEVDVTIVPAQEYLFSTYSTD